MSVFFADLGRELRESLLSTLGLLDLSREGAAATLARLASKLLVSALLLLIFAAGYILLRSALRFLIRRFRLSLEVSRPLTVALRYMLTLLATLALLSQLGVSAELSGYIARAAVMAFLYYLGWLVGLKLLTRALSRYRLDPSLVQLLRNVASVMIVAFGFASVLAQFGVNVVSLITGLGVVGIAVGFAAQDTLANFIAGTTLLLERPFRIGDWVQINGQIGRVQEITLRNTRLVTRDNVYTSIPNASVSSSEIINYTAGGPLRLNVELGIAYGASVKAARTALLPILQRDARILSHPEPTMRVEALADSSVNLLLIFWIAPEDIVTEPKIRAEVLEASKEALDAAGIQIPFPHLQLYIDGAKGLEALHQRDREEP